MLSDVEILDMYFAGGLPSTEAFPAWQRIKTALVEALKPSHNSAMVPCPWFAYGCLCLSRLGFDGKCNDVACMLQRAQHQ